MRRPSGPVLGLLVLLVLFVLLLAWRGQVGTFFSVANIQVLLHKNSIQAICALGMLLIMISGGIDLSVGSVVALVSVVTMQTFRLVYNGPEYALPKIIVEMLRDRDLLWAGTGSLATAGLIAVPAGLLAGLLCGIANGMMITRLKLTPFVATLGMLSMARGLAYWAANRTTVTFRGPRPGWVDTLQRSGNDILLLNPGVWAVLVLALVIVLLLRLTVFGRYCYAIGSNEATARLCGISVERNKLLIYGLAGLFFGLAGVLRFTHGTGADPGTDAGLELEVIAAVVVGGASLSGGQGTVLGALLGVLILGILENAVNIVGVPVEVKYILIGAMVVINTAISQWQRRRSE